MDEQPAAQVVHQVCCYPIYLHLGEEDFLSCFSFCVRCEWRTEIWQAFGAIKGKAVGEVGDDGNLYMLHGGIYDESVWS